MSPGRGRAGCLERPLADGRAAQRFAVRPGVKRTMLQYSIQKLRIERTRQACRNPNQSSQVETIQIHHLDPGRDEVLDELLPRVRAPVDLGQGPELRVRAEDQVDARPGPLDLARLTVTPFEHVGVLRNRLPLRAHIEQVYEEVVGQCLGPPSEDTMLGAADVSPEDT